MTVNDRRRWPALIVVLLATFMDMIDVTIVNVALPRMQEDLQAAYSVGQWVLAGYALAYALLLVTGGRLGDIMGRRQVFLIGVAGFTIASAAAGAATSPELLIAARIAQGAFGGVMVPQVMSVITAQFAPGKERTTAFGVFGGVIGLAQVSGPLLGGVLTDHSLFGLGWRAIFFINIPVGLVALVGAVLWMRESKSDRPVRLDLPGVLLVGAASALLTYPLLQGRDLGWPAWTFAAMAASIPTLVVFALYERRREQRHASPLVPTHLFGRRSFTVGVVVLIVQFSGVASLFLVLTWDLQFGLGWSPMHVALTTLGWPIGIGATAQLANKHGQDHGRRLVGIGSAVLAAGAAGLIWTISHFGGEVTTWHLLPCMLVSGLGMGLSVGIIVNVVLGDVPQEDAGAASGVLNSTLQLGGAIGVALVGVIFFGLLGGDAGGEADAVIPQIRRELSAAAVPARTQEQIVAGFRTCFVDRAQAEDPSAEPASCKRAVAAASQTAAAGTAADQRIGEIIAAGAEKAGHAGFSAAAAKTLGYNAAVFLLAALLSPLLPRRAATEPDVTPQEPQPATA